MPGAGMGKKEPVVYAVGDFEFKLFILVPKAKAVFGIGDRVYIGKETADKKRDAIDHVKSRISYGELTNNALAELEFAVTNIVKANEPRFLRFFNEAQFHQKLPSFHWLLHMYKPQLSDISWERAYHL